MPPHPQALFSLVPANERAEGILTYRDNDRFVSSFPLDENNPTILSQGLDIGTYITPPSRDTLVTLGRKGHIKFDDPSISDVHCSFELHKDTKEVMLRDQSQDNSTQVLGPTAMPLDPKHHNRNVLIDRVINLKFGIGGAACNLYEFDIHWHGGAEDRIRQCIDNRPNDPSHALAIANKPPIDVSTLPFSKIRYSMREHLGRGGFGQVWKVANVDTGEHLALKRSSRHDKRSGEYASLKREVKMLSRVSHTHIVKYITSQNANIADNADEERLEIFMGLKSGSVRYLIYEEKLFEGTSVAIHPLLFQMLQALDYLANEGVIHRDVKPGNILFTPLSNGGYLYQLADFGLANIEVIAQSDVGTDPYKAPELSRRFQTVKMDIWSLFVTAAYATNAADYRSRPKSTRMQGFRAVGEAAMWPGLKEYRKMAFVNPNDRATAGDMLDEVFGGQGRTTSRN